METAKELRAGDEWMSQHEANFDYARDECMTEADNIVMEVEHIVHDLDQTLDVQNTLILAEAINKIIKLKNSYTKNGYLVLRLKRQHPF